MQNVSTAWKQAQEQTLVPESYVEVILNVGTLSLRRTHPLKATERLDFPILQVL